MPNAECRVPSRAKAVVEDHWTGLSASAWTRNTGPATVMAWTVLGRCKATQLVVTAVVVVFVHQLPYIIHTISFKYNVLSYIDAIVTTYEPRMIPGNHQWQHAEWIHMEDYSGGLGAIRRNFRRSKKWGSIDTPSIVPMLRRDEKKLQFRSPWVTKNI